MRECGTLNVGCRKAKIRERAHPTPGVRTGTRKVFLTDIFIQIVVCGLGNCLKL